MFLDNMIINKVIVLAFGYARTVPLVTTHYEDPTGLDSMTVVNMETEEISINIQSFGSKAAKGITLNKDQLKFNCNRATMY